MAPLRRPVIFGSDGIPLRSELPPSLQRELKTKCGCRQQRLLSAALGLLGTWFAAVLFALPFLLKIGK